MILKSLIISFLWALILYSFHLGQLPAWTRLAFKQQDCMSETSIVVFFFAVKGNELQGEGRSKVQGLLIFYVSPPYSFRGQVTFEARVDIQALTMSPSFTMNPVTEKLTSLHILPFCSLSFGA